jgi:hypothetical protein
MNIDFKKFRTDFKKAVAELETQYGLTIDLSNISYTNTNFTTKLVAKSKEISKVEVNVGDTFYKIGGRKAYIIEEILPTKLKLYRRGNRAAGFYTTDKEEFLSNYTKLF